VNDGSTDETDEVMSQFSSQERVRYIKQKNGGQANAKNTGIRNSDGEFVAFLDADDLWESKKLEKQLLLFSDPNVGVVFSRANYIDEAGKKLKFRLSGKYLMPRSGSVTEYLFFDNFVPFSSSVVRKECLEKVGAFDETLSMGIDWDLWLRISTRYKFDYVDEPLLLYRLGHVGQMSNKIEERQLCSDRIMRSFIKEYPEIIPPLIFRKALAYTYCNRGRYFRDLDIRKSSHYYLSAMKQYPFSLYAYIGLIKLSLRLLANNKSPQNKKE
jgi:glycosyltransferase involved in cell wall biosynthesis